MLFPWTRTARRSKRQWITLPVQIRIANSQIDGTTLNVSEHGMYAFAAMNLPVGAVIEIAFRPSGKKELVRTSGIVRRKAVYLYGIEFLSPVISRVPKSPLVHRQNR